MAEIDQKRDLSRDPEKEGKPGAGGADHDDCRCKETSRMTPGELLKLMISDLTFWKRPKKD